MKLFECADGVLINPLQVALVKSYQSEGKNYVMFAFLDDCTHEVRLSSKSYAEGEVKAFKQHCNGDT